MKRAAWVAMGMALVLAGGTSAQEVVIDQSKLYVSNPDACKALEEKGIDAFSEVDFLALSFTDGIQGMEFNCAFFDVKSKEGYNGIFIEAICEEPGFRYPDIIAIGPWNDTSIQVASAYNLESSSLAGLSGEAVTDPAENQGQAAGVDIYTRCDGLTGLPR